MWITLKNPREKKVVRTWCLSYSTRTENQHMNTAEPLTESQQPASSPASMQACVCKRTQPPAWFQALLWTVKQAAGRGLSLWREAQVRCKHTTTRVKLDLTQAPPSQRAAHAHDTLVAAQAHAVLQQQLKRWQVPPLTAAGAQRAGPAPPMSRSTACRRRWPRQSGS